MRTLSILIAAAALGAAAPALAASPLGGWKTPTGTVELYNCGAQMCGKVTGGPKISANPDLRDAKNKNEALRGRKLMGLVFLTGFSGGPKEWTGGKIYNPDDGNTYQGTITLVDDHTLHLRGCVVFPLCKTQTWTRLK